MIFSAISFNSVKKQVRKKGTEMRTEIIEKDIYKYDELNDDAKATVKQWYLDNYREPDIFSSMVADDLEIIFGKNNLDVEYSLGYCQGDGLNIYGDISVTQVLDAIVNNENGIAFLDDARKLLTEHDIKTLRKYAEEYGTLHVPKNKGFHSYCVADMIDYAVECKAELEMYCSYRNINTEVLNKFNDILVNLFTELCKMYEEWGYDYFYEIDEYDLSNECDNNGWEFDEDGNLY